MRQTIGEGELNTTTSTTITTNNNNNNYNNNNNNIQHKNNMYSNNKTYSLAEQFECIYVNIYIWKLQVSLHFEISALWLNVRRYMDT